MVNLLVRHVQTSIQSISFISEFTLKIILVLKDSLVLFGGSIMVVVYFFSSSLGVLLCGFLLFWRSMPLVFFSNLGLWLYWRLLLCIYYKSYIYHSAFIDILCLFVLVCLPCTHATMSMWRSEWDSVLLFYHRSSRNWTQESSCESSRWPLVQF